MIYTEELAERLVDRVGKRWQPSNGTEGEVFMRAVCHHCKKLGGNGEKWCPVLLATMAFDVSDPEYPQEWQIGQGGQPVCTAFDDDRK